MNGSLVSGVVPSPWQGAHVVPTGKRRLGVTQPAQCEGCSGTHAGLRAPPVCSPVEAGGRASRGPLPWATLTVTAGQVFKPVIQVR